MRPHIIRVADDFWNIRGSFKIGGLVDIGTQASLVRRGNGRFVFLDFISTDENVHFSSVLVLHRASKTIHVDDTLMYVRLPRMMGAFGLTDVMSFHPTLPKALEKRAGAARDFRDWAEELTERWRDAENLCAAHTAPLTAPKNRGASIHARLVTAFGKVNGTLTAHARKYG